MDEEIEKYGKESYDLKIKLDDCFNGKIFHFYLKKRHSMWLNKAKEIISKFYDIVDEKYFHQV